MQNSLNQGKIYILNYCVPSTKDTLKLTFDLPGDFK